MIIKEPGDNIYAIPLQQVSTVEEIKACSGLWQLSLFQEGEEIRFIIF